MQYVNAVLNTLCDLLLLPFRGENGWPGMLTVSCISAALFVLVFRIFSDQRALKYNKGRMLARALELLLFRHDIIVSLTAFPRLAVANASYFKELLKPVAIGLIPSILLLIQLACWYEHRPFVVGEPVLVTAEFADGFSIMDRKINLVASDGLDDRTDGLRVPTLNQINWRLRAQATGPAWVEVGDQDVPVRKEIVVDTRMQKLSDSRVQVGLWNEVLHPCEPPIPSASPLQRIDVHYPRRQLFVAGMDVPWPIVFVVLTMVFGLFFGRWMKVSF